MYDVPQKSLVNMFNSLVIVVLALLVLLWKKCTSKPENFPPGPRRLPIFGNVLDLKSPQSSTPSILWGVIQFQKKFGDIFGFYLGTMSTVVLTKYQDIKQVMNTEEAASRPPTLPAELRPGWKELHDSDPVLNLNRQPGVALSNGSYWKEQRRFTLRHLRDFGFGKSSMEDSLNEEVQKLLDNLRPKANKAISLRNTFNISIVNALWSIVIGEKLDLNDPKLMKTVELFDAFNRSAEGPTSAAANLIPFPKLLNLGLVKKALGLDQLEAFFGQVLQMVKPAIDNHKSTLDENNIRDFMDLYLLEISKTSDPKSSFHPQNGLLSLQNLMIDLFIAGTETTSSSLLWAFYFLLKYPECQPKIYQEILEQVGHNRLASLEDRPQMHFTNAFLLEAMRTGTLTPLSVFHYTFTDINIKGFTIPKNSTIIGSTYHVHFDPELFPEPDKFKPQRFLDADGKFVTDEHVIPFGVGKRYCLGKSLAEKEYFLFFVGMVQHFEIGNVDGQKLPGYLDVPCPGLIRSPLDFQLILKPRFDQ